MCAARASVDADLTARARIRAAAVRLFGRDGFAATSLRAVAKEAGVSPGLVVHHFGGKEGLRRACDEWVARELVDTEAAASREDLVGALQRWLARPDAYRAEFGYLVRTLTEGSDAADSLFDTLLESTERTLAQGVAAGQTRAFPDERAAAVVVALLGLAPLLLGRHVARAFGEPGLTPAALQRLAVSSLELLTHGLYTGDGLLEAARAAQAGGARGDPEAGAPAEGVGR